MLRWVLVLVPFCGPFAKDCRAQTPDQKASARAHFELGLHHYDNKEYQQAADEYRAACEIDPRPAYVYNLAQAERLSGHCHRAIDAYQEFLRTEPPPQWAEAAQKNIERCREGLEADAALEPDLVKNLPPAPSGEVPSTAKPARKSANQPPSENRAPVP